MRNRFHIAAILLGALVLLAAGGSRAESLKTLVMPGPLSTAHQKLEGDCSKCHTGFAKASQKTLCMACHKKVGADIKAGTGFHGRKRSAATGECKTCHSDHKGRNFDIVGLNREAFDHGLTDFKLVGAHMNAACTACHAPGKKMREAPGNCFACHQKDDAHKGSMGKNCSSCHTAAGWRKTAFDHSKTKFPLTGVHVRTQCSACHPNADYKKTPTKCAACHMLQDVHHGVYGVTCNQCHTTDKWAAARFDHSRTGFTLLGRHKALQCTTCHTPVMKSAKLATGCISCHAADDVHKGGNGPACRDCHNQTSWKKSRFDHDKDTKFALHGAHKPLACNDCHKQDAKKVKLATACAGCHRGDDPHKGQLGKNCDSCHSDTSWQGKVRFDHDLAVFPLLGLHASAPCEACHMTAAFKDAGKDCISCHGPDDIHKGVMGKDCASCHNPNGWSFWQFDHNAKTDFPLTGAHKGLVCKACHRKGAKTLKIAQTCISCHAGDDAHAGRFGQRCEQCHRADSFKKARIR